MEKKPLIRITADLARAMEAMDDMAKGMHAAKEERSAKREEARARFKAACKAAHETYMRETAEIDMLCEQDLTERAEAIAQVWLDLEKKKIDA